MDTRNIKEIIEMKSIFDTEVLNDQNILIYFGLSTRIETIYDKIKREYNKAPTFICDNNPDLDGTKFKGIPVISVKKLEKLDKSRICILITCRHYTRILNQLYNMGIKNVIFRNFFYYLENPSYFDKNHMLNNIDRIKKAYDLLSSKDSKRVFLNILKYRATDNFKHLEEINSPDQYFNKYTTPDENEVFLDAGAYDGDTVIKFTEKYNNWCFIYAFEPNLVLCKKILSNTNNLSNFRLFQKGVSNKKGSFKFNGDGIGGSFSMNKSGNIQTFEKTTIDSEINTPLTFIKMDIEGEEANAIIGAKIQLTHNKPKLAISAYHKADDLWELPLLINEINNKYRLDILHHSNTRLETVLYAH